MVLLYDILSSVLCIYPASWWLHSSLCYYFMIFFPQFSVFIRQVGDSVHRYGITYFMIFFPQISAFITKLVTQFIIISYLMIFFAQFSVFIRKVGDYIHHYGITLWYSFLSSLYLSGKLLSLFIIMVLLYDILSSVLCIYQESWWLCSSLWYYYMIFFPQFSVFIRQVGDCSSLWYYLRYDILSSVLCIYQACWWLSSSLWYY